jgi:hypothetical protein
MKVSWKSTPFLNDELKFTGFAWGGLSELTADKMPTGRMACGLAEEIGTCGVPPEVLSDILAGKRCSVSCEVQTYRHGIGGECSPERPDLTAMLQMVHKIFTHTVLPDDARLATTLRSLKEQVWR